MYKKLWPPFFGPSIGPFEGALCHSWWTPQKIIIFTGQLCYAQEGNVPCLVTTVTENWSFHIKGHTLMRRAMEADIAIDGAASIDTLGWSSMKLRAKEIFYRSSPHAKLSFFICRKKWQRKYNERSVEAWYICSTTSHRAPLPKTVAFLDSTYRWHCVTL